MPIPSFQKLLTQGSDTFTKMPKGAFLTLTQPIARLNLLTLVSRISTETTPSPPISEPLHARAIYTASQATYGLFARSVNSRIDDDPDAEAVAERFVKLRKDPYPRFEDITFAIQNPELTDTERDALIGVYMGFPISISNLPANINGGSFAGFVEGWTMRSTLSGLSITLNLSSREFSSFTINWKQAGASLQWTGVNATLTWSNATGALT
jgi:hypothetical protein